MLENKILLLGLWLLGLCFLREAPERAIGSARRTGKRGLIEFRNKLGIPSRAGNGYRFLIDGEIIKNHDEWWCNGYGWRKFGKAVGSEYRVADWTGDFPEHLKYPKARRPFAARTLLSAGGP